MNSFFAELMLERGNEKIWLVWRQRCDSQSIFRTAALVKCFSSAGVSNYQKWSKPHYCMEGVRAGSDRMVSEWCGHHSHRDHRWHNHNWNVVIILCLICVWKRSKYFCTFCIFLLKTMSGRNNNWPCIRELVVWIQLQLVKALHILLI